MQNNSLNKLIVDTFVAEPSTRLEGRLHVASLPDGTPIRVPIILINGRNPGKTLYLQAISDGNELNGIAVIHEILSKINPEQLCGQLIVVPILNIHAFHAKQAYSPVDNLKMNRCFPGRPDGTSSYRIAHKLFEKAIKQSDYCIDLHQGGVSPMIDEVRVRVGDKHELYKECLELARVFGIGYILDQKGPKGQLAQAAPDIGIPTIDPELGGTHGWDEVSIEKGVRGVMNVLKHYHFVDGEVEIPKQQVVVNQFVSVLSNQAGFVYYKKALYDHIKQRETIAEIKDVFGNVIETVRATEEGIFWTHPIYPMVASGGVIGKIGTPISHI
ncbi:succinylglutamate desuccinylase/aspartoacylase family protein [Candidatus Poribacteria bacterium]|nr:succinylglutamate desuccinylase/aspartoacylase family protein [Candidatus Poribacteria bacterium]